jgi:hypothetical protein
MDTTTLPPSGELAPGSAEQLLDVLADRDDARCVIAHSRAQVEAVLRARELQPQPVSALRELSLRACSLGRDDRHHEQRLAAERQQVALALLAQPHVSLVLGRTSDVSALQFVDPAQQTSWRVMDLQLLRGRSQEQERLEGHIRWAARQLPQYLDALFAARDNKSLRVRFEGLTGCTPALAAELLALAKREPRLRLRFVSEELMRQFQALAREGRHRLEPVDAETPEDDDTVDLTAPVTSAFDGQETMVHDPLDLTDASVPRQEPLAEPRPRGWRASLSAGWKSVRQWFGAKA